MEIWGLMKKKEIEFIQDAPEKNDIEQFCFTFFAKPFKGIWV